MNRTYRMLALAGVAAGLFLSTGRVQAQGRGNFNPEEMRQRMMDRYKESLEVKSDTEWKLIETRIQKVMDARRDIGFGGRGFMGRRPGGENQGGNRSGSEANPEADALQKAIEAKASNEEIKTKLGKYREARKAKEAGLATAREELKKVLSVRQEATAVMMGLLE